MPRIDHLLMTTDFDSLKNDGATTASFTIPASAVIAAGANATYEANVTVGQAESILAVQASNTVDQPDGSYMGLSTAYRSDRVGGGATPYSVYVRYYHTGGSGVKVMCNIWNNTGSPLTLSATPETWSFIIRTIRVPRFA